MGQNAPKSMRAHAMESFALVKTFFIHVFEDHLGIQGYRIVFGAWDPIFVAWKYA